MWGTHRQIKEQLLVSIGLQVPASVAISPQKVFEGMLRVLVQTRHPFRVQGAVEGALQRECPQMSPRNAMR